MEQVNKRYREEFDTKEKYDRYRMKSIEDKQEEIINWINENELALVIIADWVAGKEKIFDKVVDQVEKERQARGEHDPK